MPVGGPELLILIAIVGIVAGSALFGAWAANGRGLRLLVGFVLSLAIPAGFIPFAIGALLRRLWLRQHRRLAS